MPKKYGESYDPEMRTSEHGSRIYGAWKRLRTNPHVEEWDYYPVFYTWATYSGYTIESRLRLIDESKPYGPDNCEWYTFEKDPPVSQSRADEWNAVVNRIRRHFGMPLFEVKNDG